MPRKKILLTLIIVLILSFVLNKAKAQEVITTSEVPQIKADTTDMAKAQNPFPNLPPAALDSISLSKDTIPERKSNAIDAPVYYQSKDSIVMIGTNLVYLFGEGSVKYQNLELDAEYIKINTDSSLIYATFTKDSIGNDVGYPVFKQGGEQYESKTMNYNFKTKKDILEM